LLARRLTAFPNSSCLLGLVIFLAMNCYVQYDTDTTIHLMQDMESQVFVVKNAMHAEASSLFGNPHYVADALDA
jgi:hypothetical protein